MNKAIEELLAAGLLEYDDVFRHNRRCFSKMITTPTHCSLNDGSHVVQIIVAISATSSTVNFEVELGGELKDGTWLKLHNYSGIKTAKEATEKIPRLLALWELANTNL